MRARLSLLLTATVLLFLLQALGTYVASVSALARDAAFAGQPVLWLQVGLSFAALFAPAMPLARSIGRERLIAIAAALTALFRLGLGVSNPDARWFFAALVVGFGGLFLSAAVGSLERRAVATGLAAAVLLDQLTRLLWTAPTEPFIVEALFSVAAIALAARWLMADADRDDSTAGLERRAGGMRLRGAAVLALLLFLEIHVLARTELMARWTGIGSAQAAVLGVAASGIALVLLHASGYPPATERRIAVPLALSATAGAVLSAVLGGWPGALLHATGHAGALVLTGRALEPAGGRRKGWTLAAGFVALVALSLLYVPAALESGARLSESALRIVALAGLAIVPVLILIPRPIAERNRNAKPAIAFAVAAVVLAAVFGARQEPVTTTSASTTTVTPP